MGVFGDTAPPPGAALAAVLPLARHLAGSFLNRYGTPVPHYLAALASPALLDHASLSGRGVAEQPTGRAHLR